MLFFHSVGTFIIPTVTHSIIFQRDRAQPPTSLGMAHDSLYHRRRDETTPTPNGCLHDRRNVMPAFAETAEAMVETMVYISMDIKGDCDQLINRDLCI